MVEFRKDGARVQVLEIVVVRCKLRLLCQIIVGVSIYFLVGLILLAIELIQMVFDADDMCSISKSDLRLVKHSL